MLSPVFIVQLCYGIPSILLHLLVVLVLFQHHCFETAGYTIMKGAYIFQVLIYLSTFALIRAQSFPEFVPFFQDFYSKHQWTAKFVWIVFADTHLLYIPIVFSGIEKLIFLSNPMFAEQKISHLVIPMFLSLTPVSFVLSAYIPFLKPSIVTVSAEGTFKYKFSDVNLVTSLQFVYSLVYFSFLIGINMLSIIMLATVKKASKHNRKLFAIALITSILQSVYPTLQFLSATATLFGIREQWKIHLTLPYAWDLACLVGPWLQVLLNRTLRTKIINLVRNNDDKETRAYLPNNPKQLFR